MTKAVYSIVCAIPFSMLYGSGIFQLSGGDAFVTRTTLKSVTCFCTSRRPLSAYVVNVFMIVAGVIWQ